MLSDMDEARTPSRMAAALRSLATQPRPSDVVIPGLLDGIDRIKERIASVLDRPRHGFATTRQAAE
jgi:hypothetical protein